MQQNLKSQQQLRRGRWCTGMSFQGAIFGLWQQSLKTLGVREPSLANHIWAGRSSFPTGKIGLVQNLCLILQSTIQDIKTQEKCRIFGNVHKRVKKISTLKTNLHEKMKFSKKGRKVGNKSKSKQTELLLAPMRVSLIYVNSPQYLTASLGAHLKVI